MTSLIYPRYRVITGLLVTTALVLIGVGAIISLALTPLASGEQASLFAAVDSPRVIYSVQSATIQAALSVLCSICLAYRYQLPWHGGRIGRACPFDSVNEPGDGAANNSCGHGTFGGLGTYRLLAQICFGMCDFTIYGLHGVVLAHMMLNVPLAVRVMMPMLNAVPATKWRLRAFGHDTHSDFIMSNGPLFGCHPGLSALFFFFVLPHSRWSDAWWWPGCHHFGGRNI